MVRVKITFAVIVALLGGFAPALAEDVSIATWNVRYLSDGSRDAAELRQIARVIDRYDLVAIQEARDTEVLERLEDILTGYDYIAYHVVGRGQRELYAYFYRSRVFEVLGEPYVFADPADKFIREPYVAHFRSGDFDFTIITIHLLYGDSVGDRREELVLLDEVIAAVDSANGPEADILLTGDFNFPADDQGWELEGYEAIVAPSTPTTITETSSYDNIWIDPQVTAEFVGLLEVYAFDEARFGNDDEAASLAVSDHRPVAALFRNDLGDDDPEGDWEQAAGLSEGAVSKERTYGEVRILGVVAHPTDEEAITLKNASAHPVNLGGWVLGDDNEPEAYRIPSTHTIPAGRKYTFERSTFGFAVNNSGETIYLKDPDGRIVDTWEN